MRCVGAMTEPVDQEDREPSCPLGASRGNGQGLEHAGRGRMLEEHIEKGLHFFHRWGTWAIFIGRFMGPFRATVPLVAGMSELEFWPFMIANTASAVIWAVALLAFPALAAHYLLP